MLDDGLQYNKKIIINIRVEYGAIQCPAVTNRVPSKRRGYACGVCEFLDYDCM